MINNLTYCIEDSCYKNVFNNADDIEFVSYDEKIDYIKYKNGCLNVKSSEAKLKFEILNLLEEMGFSINKLGTYFYKDVIINIIKKLEILQSEENDTKNYEVDLNKELVNPYSQFYFDLARNDYDIGTKTFHIYIQHSFSCLDTSKEKHYLLLNLINENEKQINCGELALKIALYIKNTTYSKQNNNLNQKKKVKTKIN